jgi:hypothetical protein
VTVCLYLLSYEQCNLVYTFMKRFLYNRDFITYIETIMIGSNLDVNESRSKLSLVLFPENQYEMKQHRHFKENIIQIYHVWEGYLREMKNFPSRMNLI